VRIPEIVRHSYEGNLLAVMVSVKDGADIEERDYSGKTALFHAARWGHLDVAKFLIACGADVDAADAQGVLPIYSAAVGDHQEIVELLIHSGAQFDQEILERAIKTRAGGRAVLVGCLRRAVPLLVVIAVVLFTIVKTC